MSSPTPIGDLLYRNFRKQSFGPYVGKRPACVHHGLPSKIISAHFGFAQCAKDRLPTLCRKRPARVHDRLPSKIISAHFDFAECANERRPSVAASVPLVCMIACQAKLLVHTSTLLSVRTSVVLLLQQASRLCA
jgi:hypothetical protein